MELVASVCSVLEFFTEGDCEIVAERTFKFLEAAVGRVPKSEATIGGVTGAVPASANGRGFVFCCPERDKDKVCACNALSMRIVFSVCGSSGWPESYFSAPARRGISEVFPHGCCS